MEDSKTLFGVKTTFWLQKSLAELTVLSGSASHKPEMSCTARDPALPRCRYSVRRARPPVCLVQRFLSDPRGRSSRRPPIAQPQSKSAEGGYGSRPRPKPPRNPGPAGARPATSGHFRPRERGRAGPTYGARVRRAARGSPCRRRGVRPPRWPAFPTTPSDPAVCARVAHRAPATSFVLNLQFLLALRANLKFFLFLFFIFGGNGGVRERGLERLGV